MSVNHPISSSEKLILQDLQKRHSLSIKSSLDTETLSYRQYLRIIDKLVNNNVIRGWVPVFHPFAGEYKKLVWLFLRTNPRDPQDREFLQSQGSQLLSLDGVAGPYSLLALIQFSSDKDFNISLSTIDKHFASPNPIYQNIRYQFLEIIAFYKYNGFIINNEQLAPTDHAITLKKAFFNVEFQKNRPPTIEEIASSVTASSSTVQKQLKQLESVQSILGYSILIDPAFRPQVKAFIMINIHQGNYAEIIEILSNDPQITILCKIQRDNFNLLAVVFAQSINNLNAWITDLYTIDGLLDTLTTIVLKNEYMYKFNEYFPVL